VRPTHGAHAGADGRGQRHGGGAAGSARYGCGHAEQAAERRADERTAQEATRWIVRYGFEQLALHRVSLMVLEDNPRAVELYKYMCVARRGHRIYALAVIVQRTDKMFCSQRLCRGGKLQKV
jgi:hypothetical protein